MQTMKHSSLPQIIIEKSTVEPRYNEVPGTMKITLLYQVSHYIRVEKHRNIKNWDQQNYLVIRGFSYIRPIYNEVPLYLDISFISLYFHFKQTMKHSSLPQIIIEKSTLRCNTFITCIEKHTELRLFSHDGKVRILNRDSRCASWVTQCTHDRSNCEFWITQCTHERPNFGFCIPAGEECLGTLPIKHAWSSHLELWNVFEIGKIWVIISTLWEKHMV